MICTKCREQVKPVVAIDIDGTMGKYHEHFLAFAAGYIGVIGITGVYTGTEPFKKWFLGETGVPEHTWHDIKLAYRQGGMKRTMPVYPHASELCEAAILAGAELWVTTTRPYIRHDSVDPDTREWLVRNQIPYDYLIYDGQKYRKLADLVGPNRIVVVIDDLIEEVKEAASLFGNNAPILRRNVYNLGTEHPLFIDNLRDAIPLVEKRIATWRSHYAF